MNTVERKLSGVRADARDQSKSPGHSGTDRAANAAHAVAAFATASAVVLRAAGLRSLGPGVA